MCFLVKFLYFYLIMFSIPPYITLSLEYLLGFRIWASSLLCSIFFLIHTVYFPTFSFLSQMPSHLPSSSAHSLLHLYPLAVHVLMSLPLHPSALVLIVDHRLQYFRFPLLRQLLVAVLFVSYMSSHIKYSFRIHSSLHLGSFKKLPNMKDLPWTQKSPLQKILIFIPGHF